MLRRFLRFLLLKPVMWAAARFSSKPKREKIFKALTTLHDHILEYPGKRGPVIPFDTTADRFIIFSDQHKGRRNGADDFTQAEPNYLAALEHYFQEGYFFINLGDSEELWENNLWQVKKKNKATFEAEKKFIEKDRSVKVFGNHDLFWDNDPFAWLQLRSIFKMKVKTYEGVVLKATNAALPLTIFLTHGHQGDAQSDGNWFSKFFVAKIWAPLQSLLRINPNTPAYDAEKKTLHNNIMYEWSSRQQQLLLITGHTHQPVFGSLTHLERLYRQFQLAEKENNAGQLEKLRDEIKKREKQFTAVSLNYMQLLPTYFNTGCCCFSDGDITGIEISEGYICLVKWTNKNGLPVRQELEKALLSDLAAQIG